MRTWPGLRSSRAQDPAVREMLETIDVFLRQLSGSVSKTSNNTLTVNSLSIPTINEGDPAIPSSKALPIAGATAIPGVFHIPRVAGTHPDPAGTDIGSIVRSIDAPFTTFEAQHLSLVASTDTIITFSAPVSVIRIINWDITRRILVKDGAITSDSDPSATRVGFAPTTSVPGTRTLPFQTSTINLRSTGASEVTVEGFR